MISSRELFGVEADLGQEVTLYPEDGQLIAFVPRKLTVLPNLRNFLITTLIDQGAVLGQYNPWIIKVDRPSRTAWQVGTELKIKL